MKRGPLLFLVVVGLVALPQEASANAGTPLMWAGMIHLSGVRTKFLHNTARISNANRKAVTKGGKAVQKLCSDPAMTPL
jgi:hypothetical protein